MTWFLNGRGDMIRTCDLVLIRNPYKYANNLDYWPYLLSEGLRLNYLEQITIYLREINIFLFSLEE